MVELRPQGLRVHMVDVLDVVKLLSVPAATMLSQEESATQSFVVETIACCVNYWETNGVVLDPITREAVLDSLVAVHIATCKGFATLLMAAREEHDASCPG